MRNLKKISDEYARALRSLQLQVEEIEGRVDDLIEHADRESEKAADVYGGALDADADESASSFDSDGNVRRTQTGVSGRVERDTFSQLDARLGMLEATTRPGLIGALEGAVDSERRRGDETAAAVASLVERTQKMAARLDGLESDAGRLQEERRKEQEIREQELKEETSGADISSEELDAWKTRVQSLEGQLKARDERLDALEASLREALDAVHQKSAPEKRPEKPGLRQIRGVGPKFQRALAEAGITELEQVAAWTEDDIDSIASQIGVLPSRIRKEGWVESASALLSDDDR